MGTKNKISLKRIPVFSNGDGAITDMGILDAKILLRPDEVAAILRVSLSQVYAMIDQGDLETTKNKPKRIKSLSVKAHLNDQGIL
jgi:predicted DNA-binding transcriptional regulator AlpA